MLSVLNFIPDRRSSKTCKWTVAFLKVESTCTHKVIVYSFGRFVQLSVIYNTNPQNKREHTLISFKTTFIINFRHEKVDNKMYCGVCIMVGIVNRNYVRRPDSNSYLGQQSFS